MKIKHYYSLWFLPLLCCWIACNDYPKQADRKESSSPLIYPDYKEITIPPNIAPLNFELQPKRTEKNRTLKKGKAIATFSSDKYTFKVKAHNGFFRIPAKKWKTLLTHAKGTSIQIDLLAQQGKEWCAYQPFKIHVAPDSIDGYIAYRLIPPGYELWNELGIYQRQLSTFEQSPIMQNKLISHDCMNCHTFNQRNPNQLIYHIRGKNGGTILRIGDKIEKLVTKTPETLSSLVYPAWHPSGKYIAFSVNVIKQNFHLKNPNRIEVFDLKSDVVVYDVKQHTIFTTPQLTDSTQLETFPTFSPDGKTLYYCTAPRRTLPKEYDQVKYSICSLSFDPKTRTFGQSVDTLFNGPASKHSASFPRLSPNGKLLLFTHARYGNFSIWHQDADLYCINLADRRIYPLRQANSSSVESYHDWSSNSHWIVFSSRRGDGLYTRPYFAHINNKGEASKAFLLPSEDPHYYKELMLSYNIPEFITAKVSNRQHEMALIAKKASSTPVIFKK